MYIQCWLPSLIGISVVWYETINKQRSSSQYTLHICACMPWALDLLIQEKPRQQHKINEQQIRTPISQRMSKITDRDQLRLEK